MSNNESQPIEKLMFYGPHSKSVDCAIKLEVLVLRCIKVARILNIPDDAIREYEGWAKSIAPHQLRFLNGDVVMAALELAYHRMGAEKPLYPVDAGDEVRWAIDLWNLLAMGKRSHPTEVAIWVNWCRKELGERNERR